MIPAPGELAMGGGQWLPSRKRVALREALPQRVVECAALEMRHGCKPIGGSNPSLSASQLFHPSSSRLKKFQKAI
jgi:hypothetical protein